MVLGISRQYWVYWSRLVETVSRFRFAFILGLVIKLIIAYAHANAVSAIFYCYMLQNRQSHRHLSCSVISNVVLFAHRAMLNILTKSGSSYKNSTREILIYSEFAYYLQCILENWNKAFLELHWVFQVAIQYIILYLIDEIPYN